MMVWICHIECRPTLHMLCSHFYLQMKNIIKVNFIMYKEKYFPENVMDVGLFKGCKFGHCLNKNLII